MRMPATFFLNSLLKRVPQRISCLGFDMVFPFWYISVAIRSVCLLSCLWYWLVFHGFVYGLGFGFVVLTMVLACFTFSCLGHHCGSFLPHVFVCMPIAPLTTSDAIGLPLCRSPFIVLSSVVDCVRCLSCFIMFAGAWLVFIVCVLLVHVRRASGPPYLLIPCNLSGVV